MHTMGAEGWHVKQPWFEVAKKGDFHGPHTHGPIGMSAVCYVEFNKYEHTPTIFAPPFTDIFNSLTPTYAPDADEGTLVVFPASLLHWTERNASEQRRVAVSFNVDMSVGELQIPYKLSTSMTNQLRYRYEDKNDLDRQIEQFGNKVGFIIAAEMTGKVSSEEHIK